MKKLLSVSIMAMLAVSPMMAHAAAVITPAGGAEAPSYLATTAAPYYTEQTIADTDKTGVASAAYVKGAYNNAIRAINKVAATANAGQTAEQVANAVKAGINAADGNGLQDDENGHLSVKANNDGTIVVNGDGVKVGEITASNVATSAKATSNTQGADNTKLATKGYVDDAEAAAKAYAANGANLTAGTVAETALAADVQTSLGLADTALQKADIIEGTTDGTINVDGTDVAVHGLGSAAYAATTDFDAAGTAATAAAAAQTAAISAVEGKLDDGATGYDVNFKTAKIQGISVATKADVNTAINGSSVSASGSIALFEEWGDTSATANAVTVNVTGTVSKTAYTEPSA